MAVPPAALFWAAVALCVLVSLLLVGGDLRLLTEELRADSEDDSGYDPSVTHDESPRPPVPPAGRAGGQAPPAEAIDPDRLTAEVRGHLENVVETLLGESVQNASIRPAAADAVLYKEHHQKLVAAINRLTQSLCMTLQNRPVDESFTPTTALAELKAELQQAQEASMRLPLREEVETGQMTPAEGRDSLTSTDGCGEEPNSHTYEEMLATAVLTRLGEKARRAAAASFCDAAVQSDAFTPPPSGILRPLDDVSSDVIRPLESARDVIRPLESARDVTRPLESARDVIKPLNSAGDGRLVDQPVEGEEPLSDETGGVLEITIEEEIEEIVSYDDEETKSGTAAETETETEGEESRRGSLASQASTLRSERSEANSGDDVSLPGPSISYSDLNFFGGHQSVPFPELGRSLPEASPLDEAENDDSSDGTSWEENWLFCRRRPTEPNRLLREEPVPMLVPDPNQPTAVTVGTRDVDELSDLPERGLDHSLDDWTVAAAAASPPSSEDVTARLKAARDADRDRYLAAARLTDSPRRGSAGAPETPDHRREERRSSADPVSVTDTTRSVPPITTAGTSSPEVSLSRAISWSSVPSDVEQAFSAVSERLAAGSPPLAASGAAPACQASSAAKRPLSGAARTPGVPASPAEVPRRSGADGGGVMKSPESRRAAGPAGTEVMAQAGTIAQFRCRVPVADNSETHWLREGVVLEPGDRYQLYSVRDQHHLLVYSVTRRDAGRYSCLVVTGDTETWHHFTLRVLGSIRPPQQPRFSAAPEGPLRPVAGAALRLAVRVAGHPEPRVTFLREDRPLAHSDTVRIERHSGGEWVLVVLPVRPSDSGQYSVRATNTAGSASRQFRVEVQPPPEVPSSAEVPSPREVASPLPLPLSPPPARETVRQLPARLVSAAPRSPVASPPSPVTSSPSPVTSPPSFITSRDEALKETSLTEACNSVILRARPARVRSPADGGNDSESEEDSDGGNGEEICLPQPPPGTIAEREHRKWENAVAMPNNPYTLERVRQRRRSRQMDRAGYYPSAHHSSGEDVSDHDQVSTDSSKIDCGLKSINSERYRRDYYIGGSRWSSLPPGGRRQGVGSGGGSSRPVSALSEEPLPPLSVRGSSDDLRSAGSVYHSSESLAVTERVSSASPSAASSGGPVERRPSTRSSAASPAVGEDELPPEGTVRSAVERMQQLSRSAEELAGRRPRMTPPGDAADGRSTVSASPSVPVAPSPPPPPTGVAEEPQEDRRSPLHVEEEEEEEEEGLPPSAEAGDAEPDAGDGLERRPSPDGRESLASSADLPPQLPSVKELRSHFQAGDCPPTPQQNQESPLFNSSVLIVEKADPDSEAWDEPRELRKVEKLRKKTSNHKVHSLTARSVSREFREGLKLGAPLSLHSGNIRDPGLLSNSRPAADCGGQQRQPPQEGQMEMAPGLRLVATRAAFWDNKVAQEMS